jgi:cytoskeletal protein CcmA (bactofilin family)
VAKATDIRRRISYVASALVLLAVALVAFPPSAQAQWIAIGSTIPAGQVVENDVLLYGNNVVVDGTVHGDVVAVSPTVTVNGTIDGSLVTVGRVVALNGTVGGSVYSLARTFELRPSSAVDGNLHFVGLLLDSQPGSVVARDLVVASVRGWVSGEIGRALRALILVLTFDGKIGYPVGGASGSPDLGAIPSAAQVPPAGGTASTGSTLLYVSLGTGKIAGYAAPIQDAFSPLLLQAEGDQPRLVQGILPEWLVARMGEFVTLLIVGGLALWLVPARLGGWAEKLRAKPLPALGSGVLILVIFANAIGISLLLAVMILFVGIWLGGGIPLDAGFSVLGNRLRAAGRSHVCLCPHRLFREQGDRRLLGGQAHPGPLGATRGPVQVPAPVAGCRAVHPVAFHPDGGMGD